MSASSGILPRATPISSFSASTRESKQQEIRRFQTMVNRAATGVIQTMQWNAQEFKSAHTRTSQQWICLENGGTKDVMGIACIQPGNSVSWMGVNQSENGDVAYTQFFHAIVEYITKQCDSPSSELSITFNYSHPHQTNLHRLVEAAALGSGCRFSLTWAHQESSLTIYPNDHLWEATESVDLSTVRVINPAAELALLRPPKALGKHSRTEWTVEIGSDESTFELWKRWDADYKGSFDWEDNCRGIIRKYGELNPEQRSLQVKCDFVEVKGRLLMVIQPQGRFAAYHHLEAQVKEWLGTSDIGTITNTMNFYNNRIWKDGAEPQSRTSTFPYGARSALIVGDDFQRDSLFETTFTAQGIPFTLVQSEVKEYVAPSDRTNEMYAYLRSKVINGIAVNFFCTSGTYEDREALKVRARAWFPESEKFMTKEELPALLPLIAGE